jgi:signal transduction histidine kinase/DNA-binding response OmpR family regulator
MLYYSVWWLLAGIAGGMAFVGYSFYATRLRGLRSMNEGLEQQKEELHKELDYYIRKEQRTGKEAEKAKRTKEVLMATLSHEIRTPMNGVLGMALLLADTNLTGEQREYTDTIRSCGESLLTTINNTLAEDILNISKIDHNGGELESKHFDLRNCLEEVLELFAGRIGEGGPDLVYDIDRLVPEQITGDSKHLRQLLMNLIENAVRFTTTGEIFVGVRLLSADAENKIELVFEVRDTGTGIAAAKLEQIFAGIPGKESSRRDSQESIGLGLVICKKLAELMGGWIEVKSELGKGSVFTFCIPAGVNLNSKADPFPHELDTLEGKRILIVDDNAVSRNTLMKQLEQLKSAPVAAVSGRQALEILSDGPVFDLIIMDLSMPDMDGVQLAKSIPDRQAAVPLILMGRADDERYRKEAGLFSSLLQKPVKRYMFRDQLLNVFSNADQGSEDLKNKTNRLSQDFSSEFPLGILVAEDNPINQKIVLKILAKLGYEPQMASNGKEVLEMMGNEKFDLVLMDVQMPEMNGLEATRMIRSCLEIQPVIIAMTANAMQGDRDDCMQSGMDDYISKPIEMQELLAQLTKWGQFIKQKRRVPQ